MTDENKKFQPDTPSDVLDAHVDTITSTPMDDFTEDHVDTLSELGDHPNLSAGSIGKLYNQFFPKIEGQEPGKEEPASLDYLKPILAHPNLPSNLAEDFISRTKNLKDNWELEGSRRNAARKITNKKILEDHMDAQISNPDYSPYDMHVHHDLSPEYYENLIQKTRTEGDRSINSKMEKIGIPGLASTQSHTPESLPRALEFFMNHDDHKAVAHFIKRQKGLKKQDLDRLYQKAESFPDIDEHHYNRSPKDTIKTEIAGHESTDPTILAAIAQDAGGRGNKWDDSHEAAIKNPRLPKETKRALISRITSEDAVSHYGSKNGIISALLENPSISEDEVGKLAEKGSVKAIKHEKCPPEMIEARWNASDKKTDATRSILEAKNIPVSILKDIVGSNKNLELSRQALKHPKADESVVEAGLKRRAVSVNEAAKKHPLVADRELKASLLEGRTRGSLLAKDKDVKAAFDKLNPEEQKATIRGIHQKYKDVKPEDAKKETKEDLPDFFRTKEMLAVSPHLSETERKAHAEDILDAHDANFPANSTIEIYSSDGDSQKSHAWDSVQRLVNSNNKHAQKRILERPGHLFSFSFSDERWRAKHKEVKNLSSEFLSNAFDKSQDYATRGVQIIDRHGHPYAYSTKHMSDILQHSNFPTDKFNEIAFNRESYKEDSNFFPIENSYNVKQNSPQTQRTLFDKKWKDLTPEQKQENFNKVLQVSHPEARHQILSSTSVPQNLWHIAWNQSSIQEKADWVKDNDIARHAPDSVLESALKGEYTNEETLANERSRYGHEKGGSKIQKNVLESLNSKNPNHTNILKNAIVSNAASSTTNEPHTMSPDFLVKHLPSDFTDGDSGDNLITHASQYDSELHADLAKAQAERAFDDLKLGGEKDKSPDLLEKLKQHSRLGSEGLTPEGKQNSQDNFWRRVLSKTESYSEHILQKLKTNGADLDFLFDSPDSDLRSMAAGKGLISQNKMNERASSDPEEFNRSFRHMADEQKHQTIRNFLNDPNAINKNNIKTLVDHTRYTSFIEDSAWRRRNTINPEKFHSYVQKMAEAVLIHNPSLIMDMTSNMLSSYKGKSLALALKKKVVSSVIDTVKNNAALTPKQKNNALYNIYAAAKQNDPKNIGTSVLGALAKDALSRNDVNTLIALSNEEKAPAAVSAALAKMMSNPEKMEFGHIFKASALIASNKTSLASAKKLIHAFEQKAATEQMSPTLMKSYKEDFLKNVNNGITHSAEDEESNSFLANTLRKYTTDPELAPTAYSALRKQLTNSTIKLDDRINIYTSMPSDSASVLAGSNASALEKDFANNPKVVEASTNGWKLATLMNSELAPSNLKIIVPRVLENNDPEVEKMKPVLLSSTIRNAIADAEDVIKMARAMPDHTKKLIDSSFEYADASYHRNIINTHLPRVAASLGADLDHIAENPSAVVSGSQLMDKEHRSAMIDKMFDISKIIGGSHMGEDVLGLKDKLESINDQIENLSEKTEAIFNHHISLFNDKGKHNKEEVEWDLNSLEAIGRNIVNSGLDFDRENALKVLKMITLKDRGANVAWAAGGGPKDIYTQPVNEGEYKANTTAWLAKAQNLKTEDWQQVLTEHPHLKYSLDKRAILNNDILDHTDYDAMFKDEAHQADRLAAKTVADWFPKMTKEALEKHGQKLVQRMFEAQNMNGSDLVKLMDKKIFPYAKDVINYNHAKTIIANGFKDGEKFYSAMVKHGIGGAQLAKDFLTDAQKMFKDKEMDSSDRARLLEPLTKSPALDDDMGAQFIDLYNSDPENYVDTATSLLQNLYAPKNFVNELADQVLKGHENKDSKLSGRQTREITEALMKNPSLSEEKLTKIFQASQGDYKQWFGAGTEFHPALSNPTNGGKLFRSIPLTLHPDFADKLDVNKMPKFATAEDYEKKKASLQNLIASIPPEGIAWTDFKKKFPKLENVPEIKKLFMDKKNKPVMQEDLVNEMKNLDQDIDKKGFFMTYGYYSGAQHHNDKPSLVVQLNNSEHTEAELSKDPRFWALYQHMLKETNGISGNRTGSHPTTPQLLSWARVDVHSKEKGWVIEEFQSDFAQKFRKNIRRMMQNSPGGLQIDGQTISMDDILGKPIKDSEGKDKVNPKTGEVMREGGMMAKIDKVMEGQAAAAIRVIKEAAKNHGCENLYMHGVGVRAGMSGGCPAGRYEKDFVESKDGKAAMASFFKIYDQGPKEAGFQPCDYTDYPEYSNHTLKDTAQQRKLSTQCWKMDLKKKA